jgi:glycosyltransferase involved in cell wall biosynthesis
MIVKNEAHVILRCLESTKALVDYVLIEDTGSSDGTQQLIRDWLEGTGIRGAVYDEPWKDFAYNRSHALSMLHARARVDYALIIDADDQLVISGGFDALRFKNSLSKDAYSVEMRNGAITYRRNQICKNDGNFQFRGVIHEFLENRGGRTSLGAAEGFYIVSGREGARNKDPRKYQKDVEILEHALQSERDAFLRSRYVYYLARSHRDAGERDRALQYYLSRLDLGHWSEEIFDSAYNAAEIMKATGKPFQDVISMYLRATSAAPSRAEALHAASRFCREKERFAEGFEYARRGLEIPLPTDGLFVQSWVYEYGLLDEYAVNAYWIGKYGDCAMACERLLSGNKLPPEHRARVVRNKEFALSKQQDAVALELPELRAYLELLHTARAKEAQGYGEEEVLSAYTDAIAAAPDRGEALHGAARFCRIRGRHEDGYEFARRGLANSPPGKTPSGERWIYDYGLLDEAGVNAYWTGRMRECVDVCQRMLDEKKIPPAYHVRIKDNLKFATNKLELQKLLITASDNQDPPSTLPSEPVLAAVEFFDGMRGRAARKVFPIFRTIHIVWIGNEKLRPDNCIETWQKMNPGWTIRIWGNRELSSEKWRNVEHMRQMLTRELAGVADMMRWEILDRYGGFAVDADSFCVRPLENWLFEPELFACWENEIKRPGLIANGYVYSRPGNPLIRQIIQDIHELKDVRGKLAWQLTGPQRLTDTVRAASYSHITIYPSHYFCPRHFTGAEYLGGGPVFAKQFWGTALRGTYETLMKEDAGDLQNPQDRHPSK